jgi:hypothetical protein
MSTGEALSLLINIAVGIYFAYFYPRHVRRQLGSGSLPRGFATAIKILQPVGVVLIIGTLFYGLLRITGAIAA